jgi:H+/Cl- antiporter ClcA
LDLVILSQVVIAGIFFGFVSDFMVTTLKSIEEYVKKIKLNPYMIAFGGGVVLLVLTFFFSDRYLGLGLGVIENSLDPWKYYSNDFHWYDFVMKTVFTGITLAVGGSGGVVTPIFFVGATSGLLFGHIMGDHVYFFAALGFVSVLAGTTNTPIASIIMSIELFGPEIANYAAISAIITYLITGHRSVYPSQKLGVKKSDAVELDEGSDIEHTKVNIDSRQIEKLNKIKRQLRRQRIKFNLKDFTNNRKKNKD